MAHQAYIHKPDGAKRAVLMVHGICGTPRHFDFLLPVFDESWAVYNILLDGHGGSVRDFARSSMEKWKAQTRDMLDMLSRDYDHILVVGHSMGTLLLQQALPLYSKVRGCILFNVPMHPWVRPAMMTRALRLSLGRPRQNDPQEQLCLQDNSITLSKNLFRYIGWIPRYWELLVLCRQCRKQAGKLSVPGLIYFGKIDELVSIRSRKYYDSDPAAQVTVFEKAGHFGFLPQEQAAVLAQIRDFLKALEA